MHLSDLAIVSMVDPAALSALAADALEDGHTMLVRLIDEWQSGKNRFDRPGERLYSAKLKGVIYGVRGLNIDPFCADPRIGRVRRLYVCTAVRRSAVGSRLIRRLVQDAKGSFHALRLRTYDVRAAAFYEAIGFSPVADEDYLTHRMTVAR
jgi:GNAT superfamily N-acetyltransferase